MHRGPAVLFDQHLEVTQEGRLARILRLKLPRGSDLIELKTRAASCARVHGDTRLGVVVLGNGKRYPLKRGQRQLSVPEFGTEPGVSTEGGRGTCQHTEEVRQLTAGRKRTT
jgi:hypothetical protein